MTEETKTYWYDVCNDYTMDLREEPDDLHLYETWDAPQGMVYNHIEYDEIHYLKSTDGNLTGIELH